MILIIDDDIAVRTSLQLLLRENGYETTSVGVQSEALGFLSNNAVALVVLDLNFTIETSGREGMQLLTEIRKINSTVPVILITGWGSIDLAVEGMKKGANDFITKPWSNEHLLQSVQTHINLQVHPKNRNSRKELDSVYNLMHIIGEDEKMLELLETAGRVAATDASVLIRGESGTGKELIAEAIHQNSPRASKPFVKVNLGGISTSLFESEMFGHVRGAFTDARTDRTGRFEMANKGTIFLDEIGDLDPGSQVKLLRVLQDRTFEVLGSSRTKTVDVRVVSATNRDLEELVTAGIFREDLLYRINLITLQVPPLRERPSDIPRLVDFFVTNLKIIYKRPSLSVSREAMKWLQRLHLPGNIRQLKNLVERTVLVSKNDQLGIEDFQKHLELSPGKKGAVQLPDVGLLTLEELEVMMIKKAMEFHKRKIPGRQLRSASPEVHYTDASINFIFLTMKIRTKYILFIVIIHLVSLVLSFVVFSEQRWIFLVSEFFILISIYISWQIYQQSIQPLKLLVQGADAIVDRDFNIRFVETGSYEMDKLITVYNRMMDELRIERTKQQEQHYFLEKLIHTSPTGIMVLHYDGKIEQVNPMAAALLGINSEILINKQTDAIDHPVLHKLSTMESGDSATVTMAAATYKVHKSHFMDRGFPRYFVMIEVLTAEILQAEKNAYGKVIRMMAHEVNNTIGPVNSIMNSALKKLSSIQGDSPLSEALQIAVERNSNLNIFMRNFADLVRLPPPNKQQVDMCAIVQSTARLMESRAGEKTIAFFYQAMDSPFYVFADQQQIEQVLINIIKNAIESIEGTGSITFNLDRSARILTIADTGKGIDNDFAQNLFKPFFSTKKDGQGIGLMLIREVLYNHSFNFSLKTIYDTPKRTEFVIHL